eukprot:jgi/Chlat1/845/Chrsp104S01194
MLDLVWVFTTGGMVLWRWQSDSASGGGDSASSAAPGPVDALVRGALLEGKGQGSAGAQKVTIGAQVLAWCMHNELGLVFVAAYSKLLTLLYVDQLLHMLKEEFAASHYRSGVYDYPKLAARFDHLLREAEDQADAARRPKAAASYQDKRLPSSKEKAKPTSGASSRAGAGSTALSQQGKDDEDEADSDAKPASGKPPLANGTPDKSDGGNGAFDVSKLRAKAGGKKGSKAITSTTAKSGDEKKDSDKKKPSKVMRKWVDGPEKLDFSDAGVSSGYESLGEAQHRPAAIGQSFMDEEEAAASDDSDGEEDGSDQAAGSGAAKKGGWLTSVFSSVTGKQALEREDVQPVLKALKEKLMTKNVAEEIAEKLCESVSASLVGRRQASFTRVSTIVRSAMEEALVRILTPRRSTDILRDVLGARERGSPYTIVFVGVNGVGKSTNLAKVAYWLQQHDISVLIAACDTFRAGAVEQLRTHCSRLQVPLFERGYEKDPAAVAMDAIKQAQRDRKDVVLIDTAGRMQDNEPLMRALAKLVTMNEPDLVLFVGEALVGNDAVDQLTKFNQKLADLSTLTTPRLIDGILLTKFDTIDDKVGAALSMAYTSGAPIMFVGCGQDYTDLRKLSVRAVVKALLA